jgi:hypothetical protein
MTYLEKIVLPSFDLTSEKYHNSQSGSSEIEAKIYQVTKYERNKPQ